MAYNAAALPRIRQAFDDAGVSVSEWAAEHGFRRESVYAVLSGRSKARRGEAHRIAVALGLKSVPKMSLFIGTDRAGEALPRLPSAVAPTPQEEDAPMS